MRRLASVALAFALTSCASIDPTAFIKDQSGEAVTLAELRGRQVVVINFWADWCKGCVEEMPRLAEVTTETNAVLLPAYFTDQPRSRRFRAWLDAQPAWFRERVVWAGRSVRAGYELNALPFTVVLAKSDGHLVEKFVGTVERRQLREAIERAANE